MSKYVSDGAGLHGRFDTRIALRPTIARTPRVFVKPSVGSAHLSQSFQARGKAASAQWRTFTAAEAASWTEYARLNGFSSPYASYAPLATKLIQMNPDAVVPRTPPTSDFQGDVLSYKLEPTTEGVQVISNQPNDTDVTTEILIQRIGRIHCQANPRRYVSRKFSDFASLSTELSLRPGAWAIAIRYVNTRTGQVVPLQEIGKIAIS